MRAEFPDATHHCWAWRLPIDGPGGAGGNAGAATGDDAGGRSHGTAERAHDAGEPAGTAGPPILQAVRSAGLTGLVVVVSRWFGGTKLGKGGLARAYREAARAALAGAPAAARPREVDRVVRGPIGQDGSLRHLLARHGARVVTARYDGDTVVLAIRLPADAEPELRERLETATRGAGRLERAGPEGGPGV